MKKSDYRRYYFLESYLFGEVRARFQTRGSIGAFDLLSIISWKSVRSRPYAITRLLMHGRSLELAARRLTRDVRAAGSSEAKFLVLDRLKFRLPIASAVLTVLYPRTFTIYDKRVCEMTRRKYRPNGGWAEYDALKSAVLRTAPRDFTLRDKDRWLWGKSKAKRLSELLRTGGGESAG